MKNSEIYSTLYQALAAKGNPAVLMGATAAGKSKLISYMAQDEAVERLLETRVSEGKGGTVNTAIVATDDPAVPTDHLLVGGYLRPTSQAEVDDDHTLLGEVLFYAAKVYDRTKSEDSFQKKVAEELDFRLVGAKLVPDNVSLAYRLRDISETGHTRLLQALTAFQPGELQLLLQEAQALYLRDSGKALEKFKELLRGNVVFQGALTQFWDTVLDCLNESLNDLLQLLGDGGALIQEEESRTHFFIALDEADVDKPLTTALLKSENGSKEYFFEDLTLVFRGFNGLFPDGLKNGLTVLEREGTPIHCWRFVDTQGLFHEQKATTTIEASRVQDLLSCYHSNRLVIVLDSRVSNTSKDSDAAVCRMLGALKAQCEVYFIYTQWDRHLSGCTQKVYESQSSESRRKKVDWNATYVLQVEQQNKRHGIFEASLASNQSKKRPTICGIFSSAILDDGDSASENLLEEKGITVDKALKSLAVEILTRQARSGPKFRVTEGMKELVTLNTDGLGNRSISELHSNLNHCKTGRLYASTVRASTNKWRFMGDEHEARVNDNPYGFIAIRTEFVPRIRNYAETFIKDLRIDVSPCLCNANDAEKLEAQLINFLNKHLGHEVAKEIGQDAYDNAFTQPIPYRPFPYQYERLHQMFDYAQRKYFPFPNIPLMDAFAAILKNSIKVCVQNFVDALCIVVL